MIRMIIFLKLISQVCFNRYANTSFLYLGTVIPAAMMFTVSQLGPDQKYLLITFITIGLSLAEITYVAGFGIILMDVAPNYFGTLKGINNTLGLTPGFIMPLVIGALTSNVTTSKLIFNIFSS